MFICNICMNIYGSLTEFEEHWQRHSVIREKYSCIKCEMLLSSFEEFVSHSKQCNFTEDNDFPSCKVIYCENDFVCKSCELAFESDELLRQHTSLHGKRIGKINITFQKQLLTDSPETFTWSKTSQVTTLANFNENLLSSSSSIKSSSEQETGMKDLFDHAKKDENSKDRRDPIGINVEFFNDEDKLDFKPRTTVYKGSLVSSNTKQDNVDVIDVILTDPDVTKQDKDGKTVNKNNIDVLDLTATMKQQNSPALATKSVNKYLRVKNMSELISAEISKCKLCQFSFDSWESLNKHTCIVQNINTSNGKNMNTHAANDQVPINQKTVHSTRNNNLPSSNAVTFTPNLNQPVLQYTTVPVNALDVRSNFLNGMIYQPIYASLESMQSNSVPVQQYTAQQYFESNTIPRNQSTFATNQSPVYHQMVTLCNNVPQPTVIQQTGTIRPNNPNNISVPPSKVTLPFQKTYDPRQNEWLMQFQNQIRSQISNRVTTQFSNFSNKEPVRIDKTNPNMFDAYQKVKLQNTLVYKNSNNNEKPENYQLHSLAAYENTNKTHVSKKS